MQLRKMLESRAKGLEPKRLDIASKAGLTFRAMQPPLHLPLINLVSELARIEDRSLPNKLLLGLPIVGPADESPFFEPLVVPAKLTVPQLLLGAPARRARIVARIEVDATHAKPELLSAVFNKTMAEVEEHKMGPPLEEVDVRARYDNHYNIVQRYGIEQGVDELGSPKFRCIDNH